MFKLLLVFVGGGIGSVLRYGVGLGIARLTPPAAETPHWLSMYPVATLLVNLAGCGLIGLAWGLMDRADGSNGAVAVLLVVGVLGGFTTFSAFGWETLELMNSGRIGTAAAYALISVCVGVLMAWSGHALGMSLSGA
ncbi:MAG: fluoride efflux transporter CrcB [Phycisphaerales bacterium]